MHRSGSSSDPSIQLAIEEHWFPSYTVDCNSGYSLIHLTQVGIPGNIKVFFGHDLAMILIDNFSA